MLANLSESSKNNIRAISLSLLLPIWNFFTNKIPLHVDFLRWLAISFTLYCLWQAIYFSSKGKGKITWLKILISYILVAAMAYILFVVVILHDTEKFRWLFLFKFFMVAILFRIIQFGIIASDERAYLQMERQQILAENYRVQLQELRTKVDPHFLFNSLNTLRAMIRQKDINAEKFVMSLSDFYRQTLRYNESSTVTISQELNVMESYLFLMASRNRGCIKVVKKIDDNMALGIVPTLSLQILLENCFKHNRMSVSDPLEITIYMENGYIGVKNTIQLKMTRSEPSGYGLDNLRKRYELLGCPEKSVVVWKTDKFFDVKLKIMTL